MVKYSLIVEYLKKGNNYSQIATLCGCSRTTVWEVVKRIDYFKIQLADIDALMKWDYGVYYSPNG